MCAEYNIIISIFHCFLTISLRSSFAPALTSISTTSIWPGPTAFIRGVIPFCSHTNFSLKFRPYYSSCKVWFTIIIIIIILLWCKGLLWLARPYVDACCNTRIDLASLYCILMYKCIIWSQKNLHTFNFASLTQLNAQTLHHINTIVNQGLCLPGAFGYLDWLLLEQAPVQLWYGLAGRHSVVLWTPLSV